MIRFTIAAILFCMSGSALAQEAELRDDGSLTSARISVMVGDTPEALLKQCSRDAPKPGDAYFQPNEMEVGQLDGVVTDHMMKDPELQREFGIRYLADLWEGWNVTVLGITRGDRHFLYGSYEPSGLGGRNVPMPAETSEAPIICDGGPRFFGVEIDQETLEITHIALNGSA